MKTKPKILFWLNGFFLHFSLAYYLQSRLDADFFGIVDINSKPKKFFQDQTLVNFKRIWFFHDHIKETQQKPDLEYLANFEKKYQINLWKLALNERFFYLHNHFYKFTKQEILSILEQESKLFESILDEIKPDYFLTYDPVFHHQKLLLDLCRAKDVKILSTIIATGIDNKTLIVNDGATYDLNQDSMSNKSFNNRLTVDKNSDPYDVFIKKYLNDRNVNLSNKFLAFKEFLFDFESNDVESNFMYYGRSKFNVIKDTINLEFRKNNNFRFLQQKSTLSPNLKTPYVYFPMSVDEEMNLLHYAPYYTNQIEVIRHIAKSIPINYLLYVKEHIGSELRGWHNIDYYKQIIDIPNVTLIHPRFDHITILKNANLVTTIRGSSSLLALKYEKPVIVFGEQAIRIMPSVFTVDSLNSLPELIKKALTYKVNPLDYKKYVELLKNRLFEFNMFEYENIRNKALFIGCILSNTTIHEKDVVDFLTKNQNLFSNLLNEHLKLLS